MRPATASRVIAGSSSARVETPGGQRLAEQRPVRVEQPGEAHETGGIRRAEIGDVGRLERQAEDEQVLQLVVGHGRHVGGHHEPRLHHPRHRSVEVPRHRSDRVARVERALDRRAHDAQRASGERLRAGAVLQIREDLLLGAVNGEHGRGDRHVLGRASRAAGLCVERRRLGGERGRAGEALPLDVGTQVLVVLHRHARRVLVGPADGTESVSLAELGGGVGGDDSLQRGDLRLARRGGGAVERPPEAPAVQRHAGADDQVARCAHRRNGAASNRRNERG